MNLEPSKAELRLCTLEAAMEAFMCMQTGMIVTIFDHPFLVESVRIERYEPHFLAFAELREVKPL